MTGLLPFHVLVSEFDSDFLSGKVEVEVKPFLDGTHVLIRLPNGFGASVLRHMGSYGGPSGLWEMAVIKWEGRSGVDKPWDFVGMAMNIPDFEHDVQGWMTETDVDLALNMVSQIRR